MAISLAGSMLALEDVQRDFLYHVSLDLSEFDDSIEIPPGFDEYAETGLDVWNVQSLFPEYTTETIQKYWAGESFYWVGREGSNKQGSMSFLNDRTGMSMRFFLWLASLAMPTFQSAASGEANYVMVGCPKGFRRLKMHIRMLDMDKSTVLDSRILDWVQVIKVGAGGQPSKEGSGTLDASVDIVWDVNLVNHKEAWQGKRLSVTGAGDRRELDTSAPEPPPND